MCVWKGIASYFTLRIYGATNPDTAWCCPEQLEAADEIAGRGTFWKGVTVASC